MTTFQRFHAWLHSRLCVRLCYVTDDIRTALNVGTTLTSRMWLSAAGLLQGLGFLLQSPSWLSHAAFQSLNSVLPLWVWGASFCIVGSLGMWRVFSNKSRPMWAWLVNFLTVNVWSLAVAVRYYGTGPVSFCSLYTVFTLVAFWVMLRTEATKRDTETA